MDYEWDFATVLRHLPDFLWGAANTLKLVGAVLCLSVPLGLLLAIIRQQKIPVLSAIAVVYIDFYRTTVSLVHIFWCYYALPVLLGVSIGTFTAVVLALGLQSAAFMAEIFRGGIESISRGQWEAARALGMPRRTVMHYVVLPQAVRRMLPVFFLSVVEIMKNTALAGVVTYNELFYTAFSVATTTFRTLETFTIVGLFYFVIIFGASSLARFVERRLARVDR